MAANQCAGQASHTGLGHCYCLYSSSIYSQHMDEFPMPEVLTPPLEDVILAMKAMQISNVANFPFPTPPGQEQLEAATTLMANLGCMNTTTTTLNKVVLKEDSEENEGMARLLDWDTETDMYLFIYMFIPKGTMTLFFFQLFFLIFFMTHDDSIQQK